MGEGGGGGGAGAGAATGGLPSLPRGITRLYLLETKGVHELAGHMQTLVRTLEALKKIVYKTLKPAALTKSSPLGQSDGTGGAGAGAGAGAGSLYVVKSSEFPGRTFMMAAKPKPASTKAGGGGGGGGTQKKAAGGGGGSGAKAHGKLLSPIVETGPLGDEVVGVLKGYANRLVLALEGSAFRVSGGLLEACAGYLSRGNALTGIVLQVRYEHAHCSPAEAHAVIEDFASLCTSRLHVQQQQPQPATTAAAAGGGGSGGLRMRRVDTAVLEALLGANGSASATGRRLAGPELLVLHYVELFAMT